MSPNPVKTLEITKPSHVRRNIWCSLYPSCLDRAIDRGWSGFSCGYCNSYIPIMLEHGTLLEDTFRCAALLFALEHLEELGRVQPRVIAGYLEAEAGREEA
jgi:hypothetical protein